MSVELIGTSCFALAVLHTFLVAPIRAFGHRFEPGSVGDGLFHFLGEIEVVFGLWAAVLLVAFSLVESPAAAIAYFEAVDFTEPLFVFAIMALCSTRPILEAARALISALSRALSAVLRIPPVTADVLVILIVGPLCGSFITEPAAMTVTALLLLKLIEGSSPPRLLYGMLGVLFVNVSIGGALTPYAAPPILMVAKAWGWDFARVFGELGWKCAIAVVLNAVVFVVLARGTLARSFRPLSTKAGAHEAARMAVPLPLTIVHFAFLVGVIVFAHHAKVFLALFLFFLGVVTATKRHQETVRIRESLLVAFFLGGIIVFGPLQAWWLKPLLARLGELPLFLGATALTAVTDNAALTFLGSQVPDLSEASKIALVGGALAGGGLTLIANAPNPAGAALLQRKFPEGQIAPMALLRGALLPTAIAAGCLWFL